MTKLRLIAGSGRSGTTWVLDAVAEANGLRPIFEPLHPDTSRIASEFGYAYLTHEIRNDQLNDFFTAVANNASRSIWTSYRIRPIRLRVTRKHFYSATEMKALLKRWKTVASRYWTSQERERRHGVLVKCIRTNLMLDWICANFDAKIVLLMRHPCAVVESQLRFPEHWDPYWLLARYRNDKALMDGPLKERAGILNWELTRLQAVAALWCIENLIPATQAAANRYRVVFYEELLERPEQEWQRIVEGLGLPVVPEESLLQQPSQQAAVRLLKQDADGGGSYSRCYGNWRKQLTTANLRQIAKVLDAFGIEFYKVSEDRPNVEAFTQEFL